MGELLNAEKTGKTNYGRRTLVKYFGFVLLFGYKAFQVGVLKGAVRR
jgi:hypothetical protein